MANLRAVREWIVMFGLFAMMPLGCSDSDSIPPASADLTARVNVLSAANATLTPVVQDAGQGSGSAADQAGKYSLILENVSPDVIWYVERPDRESGKQTVQNYVDSWSGMYGEVSPNSALDGNLEGETIVEHDGLYLQLEEPLYDANTNRLTFPVTLLGSTMTEQHPDIPVDIDNIKMTVLNNSPEGEAANWFFGQTSPDAVFEVTETDALFKLYLDNVYWELYQIQNAPGSDYVINTAASLVDNWSYYFDAVPPNASLTAYTETGELQVVTLELDNPSYEDNIFSYDAKVLLGDVVPGGSLSDATLLIDSPNMKSQQVVTIANQRPEAVYVQFSRWTQVLDVTWEGEGCHPQNPGVKIDPGKSCKVSNIPLTDQTRFCATTDAVPTDCADAQTNGQTLIEINFEKSTQAWSNISVIPQMCTDADWADNYCEGMTAAYNLPVSIDCSGDLTLTCKGPKGWPNNPAYPGNCGNPPKDVTQNCACNSCSPCDTPAFFSPLGNAKGQPYAICNNPEMLQITYLAGE